MNNKITILAFATLFSLVVSAQHDPSARAITQQNPAKIDVYPNPAVDFLVIDVSHASLAKIEFELHSIIGNQMTIQVQELGGGKYRIPVKEFASGYYFLVVKDDGSRFKQAYKFLKD